MVHIYTSVVNRPDFLKTQIKLFKKFIEDKYVFHVIDDSVDKEVSSQIKSICLSNKCAYHKSPDEIESDICSIKVGNVIQWAFDSIIKKENCNDLVFWLDSDMFLINHFSIKKFLSSHMIAARPDSRGEVKYMWNGIMFFNMAKIIDFDSDIQFKLGHINGESTDTGGYTYYYFNKNNINPFEESRLFKPIYPEFPEKICGIDISKSCSNYNMESFIDQKFLHYRAGSNWHSSFRSVSDPLPEKTKAFNLIIDTILK